MSLQHSEARRDRLREILHPETAHGSIGNGREKSRQIGDSTDARFTADTAERTGRSDVPPPSPAALSRIASKHGAEARRVALARRLADEVAEARALGVAVVMKPTLDPRWSEAEDAVVRALYPDFKRMAERLPGRSRGATSHRADALGLVPPRKLWTPAEVAILRRLWSTGTHAELRAALPRWDMAAIDHKARRLDLKGRGRPPLMLTGDPLCDAIRDRCRVLGYSMAYLDRIAASGTYFQGNEWNGAGGHRIAPMVRAVRALGGVLGVEFPD